MCIRDRFTEPPDWDGGEAEGLGLVRPRAKPIGRSSYKAARHRGLPTHARVPWMTHARVRARSARLIDRKGQGHRHCFAAGNGAMQNNPNPRTPAMRHTNKVELGWCDRASIALPKLPSPINGLIMLSTPGNRTIAHHPMLSIGTFV